MTYPQRTDTDARWIVLLAPWCLIAVIFGTALYDMLSVRDEYRQLVDAAVSGSVHGQTVTQSDDVGIRYIAPCNIGNVEEGLFVLPSTTLVGMLDAQRQQVGNVLVTSRCYHFPTVPSHATFHRWMAALPMGDQMHVAIYSDLNYSDFGVSGDVQVAP